MRKRSTVVAAVVLALALVAAVILLPRVGGWLPGSAGVAPTWTPGPPPTKTPIGGGGPSAPAAKPPDGSAIELRVQFSEAPSYSWQELWTVVEWQDQDGVWHAVEGWQGALDEVEDGVATKGWWVAKADLGRGPFRWKVYREEGGALLAQSEEFDLPAAVNRETVVEITLEP